MSPVNYNFPSNKAKEIDFTTGFSEQERRKFARAGRHQRVIFFSGLFLAVALVFGILVESIFINPFIQGL